MTFALSKAFTNEMVLKNFFFGNMFDKPVNSNSFILGYPYPNPPNDLDPFPNFSIS